MPAAYPLRVGDELDQAPVGVTEVDARAPPCGPRALDGTLDDLDAVGPEVLDGAVDRAVPDEAHIAPPRPHRLRGAGRRRRAGAVDVELDVRQPVRRAAVLQLDEIGPH